MAFIISLLPKILKLFTDKIVSLIIKPLGSCPIVLIFIGTTFSEDTSTDISPSSSLNLIHFTSLLFLSNAISLYLLEKLLFISFSSPISTTLSTSLTSSSAPEIVTDFGEISIAFSKYPFS